MPVDEIVTKRIEQSGPALTFILPERKVARAWARGMKIRAEISLQFGAN
jgi:hypothetical protein